MNTNWITVILLFGWLLSGLYVVNRLRSDSRADPVQVLPSFFIGPFGWVWLRLHQNGGKIRDLFRFDSEGTKGQEGESDLIFLDGQGNELFSGRTDRSRTVEDVKKIVSEAVNRRSSDIFIDPKEKVYTVRFRVDGMIREYDTMPEDQAAAAISMIKVASGMDIAEKRRPQDGMFSILYGGKTTSFRVASVGVFGGEKISIRVILPEDGSRDISALGLSKEQLSLVRSGVKLSSGMILLCGPTGSGKTSTLYSMLGAVDYNMKNVISIEDPIERVIPHVSQMEVNVKADITFASLLRNALRQNPDVICVGEIRDEETAEVAVHAAQTGHLIIATLHSNDNAGTIVRLADLGVPLRSIAACLQLIISQRLVRKLCPHCRRKAELSAEQLDFCAKYGIPAESLFTSAGCPECGNTGFAGRQAVFEILTMTDQLRAVMESSDASVMSIQECIEKNRGENTIFNIAGGMLLRGEIPLEQFERVNINF